VKYRQALDRYKTLHVKRRRKSLGIKNDVYLYNIVSLINTLAALEQQIDQANREHQIKEFEQWKENEEKELVNEIAARR
jgi:hypothetical protein